MKKVPSVYIDSMKNIYQSLSAKVAEGTNFKKSPVLKAQICHHIYSNCPKFPISQWQAFHNNESSHISHIFTIRE